MQLDETTLPGAGALFAAAWRLPFRHTGALVRFAIVPLVIAMIVWPPTYSVRVDGVTKALTDGRWTLEDLAQFIISLPFSAAFAAAWVRLCVTGEEAAMGGWPMPIDRRTWLVAWAFVQLALVILVIAGLITATMFALFGQSQGNTFRFNIDVKLSRDGLAGLADIVIGLFVVTVWAWAMLRLSLVIPAAAMGKRGFSLAASWRMTKPLRFRFPFAGGLLFLAFAIVGLVFLFALSAFSRAIGPLDAFYVGLLGLFALFVFGHALWAGLLGAAYRALAEPHSETIAEVFR